MAGRQPIPVYQYTAEGKYMTEWACMADVRRHYYNKQEGKKPFFQDAKGGYTAKYNELPDGTYRTKSRIGREGLLKLLKWDKGICCKDCAEEKKVVEIYNLKGKKVANFRNPYVASQLLQISAGNIDRRCQNKYTHGDLIFKYKV